jgi:ribonuclease P protein component
MSEPTQKFQASNRMHHSSEFDEVFKNPLKKIHGQGFLILARRNLASESKLGLVVGKKNLPKAVARNRFKRHVRESFRRHKAKHLQVVVLATKRQRSQSNIQLRQQLDNAFQTLMQVA